MGQVLREPLLIDFHLVRLPGGGLAEVQTADYEETGGAVETRLVGGGYGRVVWEWPSRMDGCWHHRLLVAGLRAGFDPYDILGSSRSREPVHGHAYGVFQIHDGRRRNGRGYDRRCA